MLETTLFNKEEIAEELKIGTDLFVESQRTPILHNKLNVILLELKKRKTYLSRDYHKLYKKQWEYYSGKADPEVYKQHPFPFRILKGDIEKYLAADVELSELACIVEQLDNDIEFISESLKQVGQRSFLVRNMIAYLEYLNGIN